MSLGLRKKIQYIMNPKANGGGTGAVSFATDSWDVIKAEAERISNYYEINGTIPSDTPYGIYNPENNDTDNIRTITLSTNEQIQIAIIGMCHDTLTIAYSGGGTKAGITWQMVDGLATKGKMNNSNTNTGGWDSSTMRSDMSTYLGQLPNELQNVIATVEKLTSAGGSSSIIKTSTNSLFLLSLVEVMGTEYRSSGTQYSYNGEGTQYEYYSKAPLVTDTNNVTWTALTGTSGTCISNGTSYINTKGQTKTVTSGMYVNFRNAKGVGYQSSLSIDWWLRSPRFNTTNNFVTIASSGQNNANRADLVNAVSYAGCI